MPPKAMSGLTSKIKKAFSPKPRGKKAKPKTSSTVESDEDGQSEAPVATPRQSSEAGGKDAGKVSSTNVMELGESEKTMGEAGEAQENRGVQSEGPEPQVRISSTLREADLAYLVSKAKPTGTRVTVRAIQPRPTVELTSHKPPVMSSHPPEPVPDSIIPAMVNTTL